MLGVTASRTGGAWEAVALLRPPGLTTGKSLETGWHPGMSPEDKLASPGEQTQGWRVRRDPPDAVLTSVGHGGGPHVWELGGALGAEADEV